MDIIMSEEQPQQIENLSPKDERTWAMLFHFIAFARFILPFGKLLEPLIFWLIKKEDLPFVENQSKEVLNFQISMIISLVISGIFCIILIGIPIIIRLVIFCSIIIIVAAINPDGRYYQYPINPRLII